MLYSFPGILINPAKENEEVSILLHITATDLYFTTVNSKRSICMPLADMTYVTIVDNFKILLVSSKFDVIFQPFDPYCIHTTLIKLLPVLPRSNLKTEVEKNVQITGRVNSHFFQSYPLQQLAFDAIDFQPANNTEFVVVCVQCPSTGTRSFIASDLNAFVEYYLRQIPTFRHAYEIIREECPSRLYLDLEFNISDKDGRVNGDELVNIVLLFLSRSVYVTQSVFLSRKDYLELDSSTLSKFSRHVICPNLVLESNFSVGILVKHAVEEMRQYGFHEAADMVDLSVYSRNRAFRMLWSSKFNKKHILQVSKTNTFKDENSERELLLKSMICPFGVGMKNQGFATAATATAKREQRNQIPKKSPEDCLYKELQDWIIKVASEQAGNEKRAGIRFWQQDGTSLIFGISNTRYCGNIGREHKSNHVFFIVNLETRVARQGCTDAATCKGYLSSPLFYSDVHTELKY